MLEFGDKSSRVVQKTHLGLYLITNSTLIDIKSQLTAKKINGLRNTYH